MALAGAAALAFLTFKLTGSNRNGGAPSSTHDGLQIELIPNAQPSPAVPAAPPSPLSLDPKSASQLQVLSEILASRNDNDPRMDSELRSLSPTAKAALREKYRALAPEDRNGRGTIIFLLGREISGPEELSFFSDVLNEMPCLSLSDCSVDARSAPGEDSHHDSGVEVTLAYPQLVALKSIENLLGRIRAEGLTPALRDAALKAIEAGKASPVPLVRKRAAELEKKITS